MCVVLTVAAWLPRTGAHDEKKKTAADRPPANLRTQLPPGYTIPIVDLSAETGRQVVVDREPGQYLWSSHDRAA
jgi:hypothetical protein